MSRHHKMASEMQEKNIFSLECSLCWKSIEIQGDVTVQEPLEAATEAHSEGWRHLDEQMIINEHGEQRIVDGSVCPECFNKYCE